MKLDWEEEEVESMEDTSLHRILKIQSSREAVPLYYSVSCFMQLNGKVFSFTASVVKFVSEQYSLSPFIKKVVDPKVSWPQTVLQTQTKCSRNQESRKIKAFSENVDQSFSLFCHSNDWKLCNSVFRLPANLHWRNLCRKNR